jgi:hypothetical protein
MNASAPLAAMATTGDHNEFAFAIHSPFAHRRDC